MSRLIIVSNRTPGRPPQPAGLAVALKKTLARAMVSGSAGRAGFAENPSKDANFEDIDGLDVGQIDLTRADHHAYYAGFSNSILWPAFHLRLDLTDIQSHWYEGYRRVNAPIRRSADSPSEARRRHLGARLSPDPAGHRTAPPQHTQPDRVLPPHPLPHARCALRHPPPRGTAADLSRTIWSACRPSATSRPSMSSSPTSRCTRKPAA